MAGNIKRIVIDVEDTQGRVQTAAGPQEKEWREKKGKTQGRKGCKQKRMNLALWSDNYIYIKTMARANGMNNIQFINEIIKACRVTDDKYKRIQEILGEE